MGYLKLTLRGTLSGEKPVIRSISGPVTANEDVFNTVMQVLRFRGQYSTIYMDTEGSYYMDAEGNYYQVK